jgi:two-component system, NtrC family, sensor kinase
MRRHTRASGEPAKSRRSKSPKSKSRNPKASGGRSLRSGAETEVVQLRRELHEALKRQRATAEILGTISRSKFELQPILQSVVDTASQLCRAGRRWRRT